MTFSRFGRGGFLNERAERDVARGLCDRAVRAVHQRFGLFAPEIDAVCW